MPVRTPVSSKQFISSNLTHLSSTISHIPSSSVVSVIPFATCCFMSHTAAWATPLTVLQLPEDFPINTYSPNFCICIWKSLTSVWVVPTKRFLVLLYVCNANCPWCNIVRCLIAPPHTSHITCVFFLCGWSAFAHRPPYYFAMPYIVTLPLSQLLCAAVNVVLWPATVYNNLSCSCRAFPS